jgi:hypothetical protein
VSEAEKRKEDIHVRGGEEKRKKKKELSREEKKRERDVGVFYRRRRGISIMK